MLKLTASFCAMMFITARHFLLLAGLSTAYHEVDYIKILRPLSQDEVSELSRRSETTLIVRNQDDPAGILQPRGRSPSRSPPHRSATVQKTSPNSSPGKGKKPDGLYRSPFLEDSQRFFSSKQINELFPPSQARPLHLSIDKPSKRPASPIPGKGESPMSTSPRDRKKPYGLYRNPLPEDSQRFFSSKQINELFPQSQARPLHLSIDKPGKKHGSPINREAESLKYPPASRPSPQRVSSNAAEKLSSRRSQSPEPKSSSEETSHIASKRRGDPKGINKAEAIQAQPDFAGKDST